MVGKNYLKALKYILEREELFLENIGFKQEFVEWLSKNELQTKEELALKYQKFLYETLQMVIKMINQSSLETYEKSFIEFFLAFSFFRIPELKSKFLDMLASDHIKNTS